MFFLKVVGTSLFIGFLFLILVYAAQAQERNAFTREEAVIFLNHKIGNTTSFNIGKWLIGHVENFQPSHNPFSVAGSDTYQFQVAKEVTIQVKEFQCAKIEVLFTPMYNITLENIKILKMYLCSKREIITIILLDQSPNNAI